MSRALCRFNRFDLSRLPATKRKAALALQLPQWSPFPDSAYAIVWQDGFAGVWCWDNSRIEAEIRKHGRQPKSQQKIPESLLRPAAQDGLRLLKCLEGVEGQYWQDAQLMASRWWPQAPNAHDWLSFQRDCGIPVEQQQAAVTAQDLPLQTHPWGKISALSGAADQLPLAEAALYGALILALGLPTLYLGLHRYQINSAIADSKGKLAAIREKASPLFDAREKALESLARIKAIYALEHYPPPLSLMAAVAQALPKDGSFVREWDMTGNQLKITVNSPNSSIVGTTYVEALEKAGPFADVKIITNADPKLMAFAITILPLDLDKKTDVTDKRTAL